jgi:2-oxoisovalerate dehydrogenase E1 component
MDQSLLLLDPVETGKQLCVQTLTVMLRSRLLDEKMNKLVRQNKGGTFFLSNAGHEMVGALAALTLRSGTDWFFPYYRDRTLVIGLGTTSTEILQTAMGREGEHHSGGRMMPEHFSDQVLLVPNISKR